MNADGFDSRPRVAIYARQSVEEAQGILQQLDDCRYEVQRRGWRVVDEFVDNDTSASMVRGPGTGWGRMLSAFDTGDFDVLLVTQVDRLTRSLADVLEIRPPKRDLRIVAVNGGIDTADDDFMLKQLVLLAEREVRLKSARAQRYSLERRKAGHPASGLTPHGYHWVPANDRGAAGVRYVIDDAEAVDVRRIFSEFLAGAPLAQIAKDLNSGGRSTRSGSRWRSSTIRRILMNPHYAALLPPVQPSGKHDLAAISLETCTAGAWEAIVTHDEIVATRGRLLGAKPNHEGTARKWLLSGLAVCGVCRGPVRSARGETHPTSRKDGSGAAASKRYHAYRCVEGHFMRNGDVINELIAELCIRRLSSDDAVDLLAVKDDGRDIGALHARRIALQARESTIASLIASGKMSPAAAEKSLDDLSVEVRKVNVELAAALRTSPLADLAGVDDVREWWSNATLARRRSVVELLMTVAILPVGRGKRIKTIEQAADTVQITWHDAG